MAGGNSGPTGSEFQWESFSNQQGVRGRRGARYTADWPPATDALRPSPFLPPALHALHGLARALLFPAYWALDQLLGLAPPLLLPPPSAVLGAARALAPDCRTRALLRLPHSQSVPAPRRATALQQPTAQPATGRGHCRRAAGRRAARAPQGYGLQPAVAQGAAQGAGGLAARGSGLRVPAGGIRSARGSSLGESPGAQPGPVTVRVGTLGLQLGPHLKLLDSGLLLASGYPLLRATFRCFPHARGEDALASKGLLSAQVLAYPVRPAEGAEVRPRRRRKLGPSVVLRARLGSLDGRRIVGFSHCTHLQALAEDGPLRSKQLTLLLD
ncbi:uncharacterized protein LOC115832896 [Nomascus leucogenys]|uniref:uncharacterized protein LOC115832896 n=1 Tax=Nomascus leucogenys TaxID=61853 RepID=UPI00122D7DF4|nr:uncharacterized protein LOC115832896 [Nomascus leucogenys]